MKSSITRIVILLGIILFSVFSCAKKDTGEQGTVSMETARLVKSVSSGLINPDDVIRVRFQQAMVRKSRFNQALSKPVFSFTPAVDGQAFWQDSVTLVFRPNRPLAYRQKYEGTLDLQTLLPDLEGKIEPLHFTVMTIGREIRNLQADFHLMDEQKPEWVRLKGRIVFNTPTDAALVEEAVQVSRAGKRLKLGWQAEKDGKEFRFESQQIRRGEKEQKFDLMVQGEQLELSAPYRRTLALPAISAFKVTDVVVVSESRRPQIKIIFSDQLQPYQDLTGFIRIEPDMDIKLNVLNDAVMIRGSFEHGKEYTLRVLPGIRSRWAIALKSAFEETVRFEDMLPEIRFAGDGVYLPSDNQKKILFQTVNVKRVQLRVIKVFDNNLGQFLQMERLNGNRDRREGFHYNINRVGVEVAKQALEIGRERNRWLQHEIDLSPLIAQDQHGLYLLELSFKKEDMLYDTSDKNLRYSRRSDDWYYNDPASYGYIYAHGRLYKPLILSDLGITYKSGGKQHIVYVNNLLTTEPVAGARVELRTYQNQLIDAQTTDAQGIARFEGVDDKVFYVTAEKDGQRSVVKPINMAWNLSTFDTDGMEANQDGLRAFIYTERGVYRPGDPVHISVIVRNEQGGFPDNHPVTAVIKNPRNQEVYRRVNRQARDGFYTFLYQGETQDPTGVYRVEIKAGGQTFSHQLRIETVVAERLKININPNPETLQAGDRRLKIGLEAAYLFGAPAAGLQAELTLYVGPAPALFAKFKGYTFGSQTTAFSATEYSLLYGKLDVQGKADINWDVPKFSNAPGPLRGILTARVWEKGGRSSKQHRQILIHPYSFYVGLQQPNFPYRYAQTGQEINLPVIVVNPEGQPAPGRSLTYRIYRSRSHWWWEYDSRQQYRLRFKSARSTELIKKGTLVSGSTPVMLSFTPDERGEYLVEVQDNGDKGHTASLFISAYPWGEGPTGGDEAGLLALRTDRKKYRLGETARITFPAPAGSRVLFTLEKGNRVLESRWLTSPAEGSEMEITVPLKKEMLPNVYASVSVLQPHAQTRNDRPIRMYGVTPILVEDPTTRQELIIGVEEVLRPEQPFRVDVQTADGRPAQLTVAVVDEGLLSLTGFKTPDPWRYFYGKQRLGVGTDDLYALVIGANKGDIFRTFSIGGGMMMEELAVSPKRPEQPEAQRFKPVCLFEGPVATDANGHAVFSFDMPNYVGAVRVMAVSANGSRYGRAEKTAAVKTPLMVLPTLPRVIGPQDEFVLPVSVFAMEDGLGEVQINLRVQGPLRIVDGAQQTLRFDKSGRKEVRFRVQAGKAVGVGKVDIEALTSEHRARYHTELSVRASSPPVSKTESRALAPGEQVRFTIPADGIAGTNQAVLSVQRRPNFQFSRRILWLIRYPYGCIEQTVSSAFPQLFLQKFIPKSRAAKRDIDKNINETIARLQKFALPQGGFAYWPGMHVVSEWGTLYAGHFLVEAQKLGYNVPQELMKRWLTYVEKRSRETEENRMMRVYRMYVAALAGSAPIGAMNVLKENEFEKLNDVERWLLAAAYKLAGVDDVAERIAGTSGQTVKEYQEFAGTYGSTLRDKAMILEQMVLFKQWNKARDLADELATALGTKTWYSTQTTGYALLALGKYLQATEGESKTEKVISGRVILPDGKEVPFKTGEISYQLEIKEGFGGEVRIELDESSNVERAFVDLEWSGVPARSSGKSESHNLSLKVDWLDEDGNTIDPRSIKQGQTFWGHFRVQKPANYRARIEELALVQILPAGWEIENTRLSGQTLPRWMRAWRTGREEYVDIRDDRIMWFFDLNTYEKRKDFVVKLNAVTAGRYQLPATAVEAMYNNSYRASVQGMIVDVTER
ncbi:MAG TPA: alpha-2-macroglobulin family protein [Caldithrix abyssi]|uniref:Alpha-2-macroglobulin family protein n=1 Tax=Caldithrix abyssi TaxID=187145 RepID=A0A7V4TYR5_CALAY|nr:alpha-2-macroglobulin family protein [Caldithrix abyssi]